MRRRPWFWFCLSVLCFFGAIYCWNLGEKWAAEKAAAHPSQPASNSAPLIPATKPSAQTPASSMRLLSQVGPLNAVRALEPAETNRPSRLAYRLSNSTKSPSQLARSESAILMENALLDTTRGTSLPIPDYLRAQGDPGSYIVQSRRPLDDAF